MSRRPSPADLGKRPQTTPSWPDRLRLLAADETLGLAPLLGPAVPDVVDGVRLLHPYRVRRDITALVGWAGHLAEIPQSAEVDRLPVSASGRLPLSDRGKAAGDVEDSPPLQEVPVLTRVAVRGVLLGEQVELIAVTHRAVARAAGAISWDDVLALVDAERADLTPELVDVTLDPAALADPLAVGASQ